MKLRKHNDNRYLMVPRTGIEPVRDCSSPRILRPILKPIGFTPSGVKVNKIKVLEPFANPLHESAFGLKRAVNAGERGKNAGKKTRA